MRRKGGLFEVMEIVNIQGKGSNNNYVTPRNWCGLKPYEYRRVLPGIRRSALNGRKNPERSCYVQSCFVIDDFFISQPIRSE